MLRAKDPRRKLKKSYKNNTHFISKSYTDLFLANQQIVYVNHLLKNL